MKTPYQSQSNSSGMKLIPFEFHARDIRTFIDDEGTPWFVAKDVCEILGYSKYRDALEKADLEEDERMSILVDTLGGKQQMTAINESGLYILTIRSNKPEAKPFRKWVTAEVLPSIRKKGFYELRKYVCSEPIPYQSRFPNSFFEAICRLYDIVPSKGNRLPQFVGRFINKYVYSKFPHPELLPELQRLNPTVISRKGNPIRLNKHHQFLTEEKGLSYLEKHISNVQAILSSSLSVDDFKQRFEMVFPQDPDAPHRILGSCRNGDVIQLSFNFAA